MTDSPNAVRPEKREDDSALIQMTLGGDRQSFETLVRRHERRVFRVALAVLGCVEDAEEAMQDAFVKAYCHLDQFRHDSQFSTWLTRIAVNAAIQKRQSRRDVVSLDESREVETLSEPKRFEPWSADPEQIYSRQEMRRFVENAIHALPETYREVFVLRDVEGMSAEEAAEALSLTVGALKSRLLRARLRMRESLGNAFEQPRPLGKKMVHTALRLRNRVVINLMKVAGR
jgi:RNA polymerase sigma-70 factor, ECF subfamily